MAQDDNVDQLEILRNIAEGRPADFKRDPAASYTADDFISDNLKKIASGESEPSFFSKENAARQARGAAYGIGDIIQGAGDIAGVVVNPFATGVNRLMGSPETADLGRTLRHYAGYLGIPQEGEVSGVSPTVSAFTKGAAGGFGYAKGAKLAGEILASAPQTMAKMGPLFEDVLTKVGARPGIDAISGGLQASAADLAQKYDLGPVGQFASSTVAGALPFIRGPRGPIRVPATPAAEAAVRQGVDMLPADVGGGFVRGLTAAANQGILSEVPIRKASEESLRQLSEAARRAGAITGSVVPEEFAGEGLKRGARLFSKESSIFGGKLYDKARDAVPAGMRFESPNTIKALDAQIAQLQEAGNLAAPVINSLRAARDDIARAGGVSIDGVRAIRTAARSAASNDALRSTNAQRMLNDVAENLTQELNDTLVKSGNAKAALALARADSFWKNRIDQIDNVLEPILGQNKSGEDALMAVEAMARGRRGGAARLRSMLSLMPEEEAGDVRATIIDRLGRASASRQTAEGDQFSPNTFLTNWNKMSKAGRRLLFNDPDQISALNDVAKIADSMRLAQQYANTSNTARAIAIQTALGAAGAVAAWPLALKAAAAQYGTGKLLASKRFAKWLSSVPQKADETTKQEYLTRLKMIGVREPEILADVNQYADAVEGNQ